ncbi:protein sorting system archaetidylserine decarboxylase [Halovivax gelatinilyticus]|uniref:protein sorting system archaetidylserine decarboxylase n=1 Tax=Halovivax gelatinilyticus TaxID=2961597 RepID=UPI0020CA90E6|nr:protein sorting system archaetidylserine decarboxylase [Halovivax gelatinilyticus]
MNVAPGAWRYAIWPLVAAPFALLISLPAAAVLLAGLGGFVLWFFRDPDRTPPASGIVAPADGKVSVLRTEGETVRVGIFMNVWNVHVIRSPADGRVVDVEHTPGAHRPAFSKESDRNERVHVRFSGSSTDGSTANPPTDASLLDPEQTDARVSAPIEEVTLIAGAFARRITPYVDTAERVHRGDRIGHIAFGSRVDVVFGPDVSIDDVAVDPGEKTRSGETQLLEPEAIDANLPLIDEETVPTENVEEDG